MVHAKSYGNVPLTFDPHNADNERNLPPPIKTLIADGLRVERVSTLAPVPSREKRAMIRTDWIPATNPWLGAIARCSRTGSSNPSPSTEESADFRSLTAKRSRTRCSGKRPGALVQLDRGGQKWRFGCVDRCRGPKPSLAQPAREKCQCWPPLFSVAVSRAVSSV
jgi:hypothetical protein